jgi:hypothetical protein
MKNFLAGTYTLYFRPVWPVIAVNDFAITYYGLADVTFTLEENFATEFSAV